MGDAMKRMYARFVWWLIAPAVQHMKDLQHAKWLEEKPERDRARRARYADWVAGSKQVEERRRASESAS
jgi:hypothetical protein